MARANLMPMNGPLIPENKQFAAAVMYTRAEGRGMDARTLRQLYEQHGPMVYRRALRILANSNDASEAVQEVFIRVMKGADGFEQRSSTTTWLYRITTNYCLNLLRDRDRRRELLEENFGKGDDETTQLNATDLLVLRRLLADADEKQAQAAIYVFVDGMSHDEAAELLGVSRRTVGNLIERFQAWARSELKSERPPPPHDRSATDEEGAP